MTLRSSPRSLAFAFLIFLPVGAVGQSVLYRTPNLSGGWEAASGTVYFNFLHRFTAGDAPVRQVTNYPTFLLGVGLPGNILAGANYATRSDLVAAYPNEWEFFARALPLEQFDGAPVDLAVQLGYNLAAESFDGELLAARQFGRVRLIGAVRGLSRAFGGDSARFAVAAGTTLQLSRWLALAGDLARPIDLTDDEDMAWSGALQIAIPYTPHSFSLQVANTNTATLQGSSRGGNTRRYGFEFTVPITLARYFGRREAPVAAPSAQVVERSDTAVLISTADPARVQRDSARAQRDSVVTRDPAVPPPVRDTARAAAPARTATPAPATPRPAAPRPANVRMRQLKFEPVRVQIEAGGAVAWRNDDQVIHTVKAADGSWESPPIQPGGTYRRTFARRGRFEISCGPHPFMKQVVEVR